MSGSEPPAPAGPRRRRPVVRRLAAAVLLAAVVVPYGVTLSSTWSRLADDISAAGRERSGVSVLRPFVSLLAATTDAQSSSVLTGQIDAAALRAAIEAADAADRRHGAELGTGRRWTDLRTRLDRVLAAPPRGAAAFTALSQVADLELALITAVGDSSGLRLDPEVDSRYLVDAATVQIPGMLVAGGRIPDLSWIVEQRRTARTDTAAVVVAQAEVRRYLELLDDGLRKGFDSTTDRTLEPGLLRQLDQLRDAVTALSPPALAIGAPPVVTSTAAAQEGREKLRAAAVEAGSAALDQLDGLLRLRLDGLTGERRTVLAVTGGGLAVVVAVLWVMAPRRRADPLDVPVAGGHSPGGPALRPRGGAAAEPVPGGLEGRPLPGPRPLVRVGRAVTSAPREAVPPQPEGDR